MQTILKYFKIYSDRDCKMLQRDVCTFDNWCLTSGLLLNKEKTKVMGQTQKTHSRCFPYRIHSEDLCRVSEVRDLGELFDCSLRFDADVTQITLSAYRTLGMACRMSERVFASQDRYLSCTLHYYGLVWNTHPLCGMASVRDTL